MRDAVVFRAPAPEEPPREDERLVLFLGVLFFGGLFLGGLSAVLFLGVRFAVVRCAAFSRAPSPVSAPV